MAQVGQRIYNRTTGEQITFLQTAAETCGERLCIELFMDAGHTGVPMHIHSLQSETFEVLAGTFHAIINGQLRILSAGESITISSGVPHRFGTKNSGPVTLRVTFAPALETETFFETLAYASQHRHMNILQMAVTVHNLKLGFGLAGVPAFVLQAVFAILSPIGLLMGYQPRYTE